MSLVIERYNKIITNISDIKPPKPVNIIAISKTFLMANNSQNYEFFFINDSM